MARLGKYLTICLVVLLIVTSTAQLTVKAQTRNIIVPDDYSDIQTAINHANDGDTVVVRAGTYKYTEQNSIIARPHSGTPNYGVIVNKSISLVGENRNTVLSMDWSQGVSVAVCIEADNVTFSGFTIKSFFGSTIYSQIGSVGILGSNCKIINNTFQTYLSGIGNNQNISSNTFEGSLSIQFSNSVVENNILTNSYVGLHVSKSSNVTIIRNNIFNNSIGINLSDFYHDVVNNITISYNNITDNSRYGIEFEGAVSNSCIYSNYITRNGIGIYLNNFALQKYPPISNGTKIFYNNIIDNTKNAYVETEYPYNLTLDKIERRYVIGNVTDVVSWDNGVVGNYWDDYNGNGSYVIDEKNVDHYPLTQQVDTNAIAPTPMPFPTSGVVLDLEIITIALVILAIVVFSVLLYRRHRKTANLKQ
ncbi:MAG: right-handed parallel beta-helix repeat-containing protein [Candidatus Bathyarchaeota archaeon]|nr:right-handed parallel beta-helix repeat-containing protein [Candidatus Bathyarchaeota archaeon]